MENDKGSLGDVHSNKPVETLKQAVERISTPIFQKVLHESSANSMTIPKKSFSKLWRPNNYRRQIRIKGGKSIVVDSGFLSLMGTNKNLTYSSHTKMFFWHGYKPNITIQLTSKTVIGIFSQSVVDGQKIVWFIEAGCEKDLEDSVVDKKNEIKKLIDEAVYCFCREFGIEWFVGEPRWLRSENWTRDSAFIDKLPRECIVHDEVFKKVYPVGGEFVSGKDAEPVESLLKHIRNSALKDFSPDIVAELDNVRQEIVKLNPLKVLKSRCGGVQDIIDNKDLVNLLDEKEKKELSKWSFERFSLHG